MREVPIPIPPCGTVGYPLSPRQVGADLINELLTRLGGCRKTRQGCHSDPALREKNLGICGIKQIQGSFVVPMRSGLLRMTC